MRIIRWGGTAVVAMAGTFALAAPATAQLANPAFEHGQPEVTMAPGAECGEVELTFTNPTPWLLVWDVRVDGEPAVHGSVAPGVVIAEGPLAGQEFGDRWTLVEVDGSAGTHVVVETFSFAESVEVRLAEGAEQQLYHDWLSFDLAALECPEPTPTATADPEPTVEPAECVDINTATADELQRLMHVDADRAAQIVDLRPLSSADDLDRVDGLAAGGPRLAELVAGGDGFLPLCEIGDDGTPVPGTAGGGGELPTTGMPVPLMVGGGAVALGLGGGTLLLVRRKRPIFTA